MRISTASLLIISTMILAIFTLTGCQSPQLTDCQQQNAELQAEITKQKETLAQRNTEIEQLTQTVSEYSQLVLDMTVLLESSKSEIDRLRKVIDQLKKP
ncbi:MAG: hypothetical protein KAS23_09865 [Anaerohalosphaera sp.]|nr:hypothetical protein [Anaerohalosphaera sp.]